MLFSEPIFFAFFAVYFVLHKLTPPQWRMYLVILGSAVFYAWWRVEYLWLPLVLILIAFYGAAWTQAAPEGPRRRQRLTITLIVLFAPLVIFKYAPFFAREAQGMIGADAGLSIVQWPLPLGISFITFTLTAYVVDIYRGQFKIERKSGPVMAYVLFFPHLIAGPILRPRELIPQLKRVAKGLRTPFKLGLAIFTVGLVKKVVFADQLAEPVERVFVQGVAANGWEYLLAIYGFAVQIYCDFSGYTDMAIGLAYLLNIRLPTNFRRPYAATSVIDFWRRWHITLSSWLRDYLYIPLGGNRGGDAARTRNLMITMALGGLWHGANWTFVIWGILHGAALSVTHFAMRPLRRWGIRIPLALSVILTFHFVAFCWIYFRANSVEMAHRIIGGLATANWGSPVEALSGQIFPVALLAIFVLLHRFDHLPYVRWATRRVYPAILWPVIGLLWVVVVTVGQGSSGKFIYFDF